MKDIGSKYSKEKISIIVQDLALSEENAQLTDDQLKESIKAFSTFFDSIRKTNASPKEFFGEIHIAPFADTQTIRFHKYISLETYEKYIRKGKFQLGSLQLYREIEKAESRDEKEGSCNLIIRSGNREIFTSVISGFNYYVLCGTNIAEYSSNMADKFGEVLITIKNVRSFAESVVKAIGAKRWFIRKVDYSDFKAYKTKELIEDLSKVNHDLSEELFNCFLRNSTFPSIFVKPTRFSDESELRLIFEMPKDVKKQLNFHNQGLLQHIKINNRK